MLSGKALWRCRRVSVCKDRGGKEPSELRQGAKKGKVEIRSPRAFLGGGD